jgi:hypothetical protein
LTTALRFIFTMLGKMRKSRRAASVREKCLFEYAVIRLLARVEREEFVNVRVIIYCPPQSFLAAKFEINEQKVRAIAPDLEIAEIEKHLQAFEQIRKGGDKAGAIGRMAARARFAGWSQLVAQLFKHHVFTPGYAKTQKQLLADCLI